MKKIALLSFVIVCFLTANAQHIEKMVDNLKNLTRIELDASQTGAAISPQLFGHNLEHTRRAIWQGISAEKIANRKFAAVDCGIPMRWNTINGHGVSVDNQVVYSGRHSVKLDNPDGKTAGIWQQQDWLSFRKGTKYKFRIWAKSDGNKKLTLRIVDRPGFNTIFSGEKEIKSGEWQLWSGEFISPLMAKGARFEINLVSSGTLWIGAVSLMPADNFHGMRKDVVELMKQLKPGNLRWPGGCFAEYYNWKEGLLPVDQRPPIGPHQWVGLLPDSDGFDNHEIGIDEFIALCRELNCDPHITIRYGKGSPEEAASWVEYCNGAADTRWGKIRAERGHPLPYDVKIWYVGNEIAGVSLVDNKDPELCAGTSGDFAKAMKKIDSDIKLIGGVPTSEEWLKPHFAKSDNLFDMVQSGFYVQPHEAYEVDIDRIIELPSVPLQYLKSLRQTIDRLSPGKNQLGLSFYEWNIMWDREGDVLSGIFVAEMLNMFCREAESVGLTQASYFQPVTEGAIKIGPLASELEPDGHVFALFSAHQGNRILNVPASPDKNIDFCASLAPDGKSIFVTVINKNTTSETSLDLSLRNFKSENATVKFLVPTVLKLGGEFIQKEEKLPVIDGNKVQLKLPPCGVAGIHFDNTRN